MIILDYPSGPNLITRVLESGEPFLAVLRESWDDRDDGRRGRRNQSMKGNWLAIAGFKVGGRMSWPKQSRWPLEVGYTGKHAPLEPPEMTQPRWHLCSGPVRSGLDFWPTELGGLCVKSQFVGICYDSNRKWIQRKTWGWREGTAFGPVKLHELLMRWVGILEYSQAWTILPRHTQEPRYRGKELSSKRLWGGPPRVTAEKDQMRLGWSRCGGCVMESPPSCRVSWRAHACVPGSVGDLSHRDYYQRLWRLGHGTAISIS